MIEWFAGEDGVLTWPEAFVSGIVIIAFVAVLWLLWRDDD